VKVDRMRNDIEDENCLKSWEMDFWGNKKPVYCFPRNPLPLFNPAMRD